MKNMFRFVFVIILLNLHLYCTGLVYKKQYYVDIGKNVTLPCLLPDTNDVMWVRDGRLDNQSRQMILSNGDLVLVEAEHNDSGTYSCRPALGDPDAELLKPIRLAVRTPPPALYDVYVYASTILAVIYWNITGTGGYPIIKFTAQYRLATDSEWSLILNHISPNSRQIDVYKLNPNTTYAFQIWAVNELGNSPVSEVTGTTLCEFSEKEIAEHMLAGVETFDRRMWVLAVAVVMTTLLVLAAGMSLVLYQECRVPGEGGGHRHGDEQEVIELVPNIILNPGFDCNDPAASGDSDGGDVGDENSNSECAPARLNNNSVVRPGARPAY